uniref:Uncharacterized protein n=1 Tax=Cacopsylla melanoneura TaxID=428564 RepID=A0A8D9EP38_9HEMI
MFWNFTNGKKSPRSEQCFKINDIVTSDSRTIAEAFATHFKSVYDLEIPDYRCIDLISSFSSLLRPSSSSPSPSSSSSSFFSLLLLLLLPISYLKVPSMMGSSVFGPP